MKHTLLYDRKVDELRQSAQQSLLEDTQLLLSALMKQVEGDTAENLFYQEQIALIVQKPHTVSKKSLLSAQTFFVSSSHHVHHIADHISEKCLTLRNNKLKPSLSYLGVF